MDEEQVTMTCTTCGETDMWEYIGESYDDEYYIAPLYQCQNCGHQQTDDSDNG